MSGSHFIKNIIFDNTFIIIKQHELRRLFQYFQLFCTERWGASFERRIQFSSLYKEFGVNKIYLPSVIVTLAAYTTRMIFMKVREQNFGNMGRMDAILF